MIMKEMQLSPKILQDKFCNHKQCIVLHEKQEFEHLFSEIYCVPEQIKKSYYKIKVMEILLFLFALDTTKEKIENRYFNKNLVAKVKEIHQYMLNHIDEKLTIACLADKHQISATNLKKYFKEIYGLSIYAYLKEKRIQKAAELLRKRTMKQARLQAWLDMITQVNFPTVLKALWESIQVNIKSLSEWSISYFLEQMKIETMIIISNEFGKMFVLPFITITSQTLLILGRSNKYEQDN